MYNSNCTYRLHILSVTVVTSWLTSFSLRTENLCTLRRYIMMCGGLGGRKEGRKKERKRRKITRILPWH
jgi:hypothetical protein